MTHSHTTVKGHMTLTLLDAHGNPISCHENHNTVLLTGQQLLLNLLRGESREPSIKPVLGLKGFEPKKPMREQDSDAYMSLTNLEKLDVKLSGNTLTMAFRGNATKKTEVFGGGLLITSINSDGKEEVNLYNFARLENAVSVSKSMPVLLNFSLSVGG